ncbi:hypothetical protein CKO28_25235 [Rhodovibrio sodomensis]|uniref:Uncharacterized protein n=1 Tax=Rhodovibrio sodomensis TaxID=1088 RepID=A0ABS1DMF9_9PROT|nr:hypothetical protein [Rhodovibrio sodomensis]MBK1671308.1 hypothetical protein [Rhodovibrio sodomensis]
MNLSSLAHATVAATAGLALAGATAGPALAQSLSVGDTTQTKVGCTSPDPYVEFEKVYAEDGRVAAYKVLAQSQACQILERPTNVELQEAVASFDFGWGTGQVWRVTPVNQDVEAPDELFIRIRE